MCNFEIHRRARDQWKLNDRQIDFLVNAVLHEIAAAEGHLASLRRALADPRGGAEDVVSPMQGFVTAAGTVSLLLWGEQWDTDVFDRRAPVREHLFIQYSSGWKALRSRRVRNFWMHIDRELEQWTLEGNGSFQDFIVVPWPAPRTSVDNAFRLVAHDAMHLEFYCRGTRMDVLEVARQLADVREGAALRDAYCLPDYLEGLKRREWLWFGYSLRTFMQSLRIPSNHECNRRGRRVNPLRMQAARRLRELTRQRFKLAVPRDWDAAVRMHERPMTIKEQLLQLIRGGIVRVAGSDSGTFELCDQIQMQALLRQQNLRVDDVAPDFDFVADSGSVTIGNRSFRIVERDPPSSFRSMSMYMWLLIDES